MVYPSSQGPRSVGSEHAPMTKIVSLPPHQKVKNIRRFLRDNRVVFGLFVVGLLLVVGLFGPFFVPSENSGDIALRLTVPRFSGGLAGVFGRDLNGESVFYLMVLGARTSLYVSCVTVLISLTCGSLLGLLAGFFKGWVDQIIMRVCDLIMAFPGTLLAMALAALLGPSLHNLILAMVVTGWTASARLMRAQVLSVMERDYLMAARSLGCPFYRLAWHHVLPSTWSGLLVHGTFSLSGVIVVEASLSFLGLGAQDGSPSWGALLAQGRTVLVEAPYLSIIPGAAMALLVLALNFTGDALRDHLDPRK